MYSIKSSPILIPILYLLVLFLYPVYILFFLPLIVIRKCVSILGKVFDGRSLGKILSASGTSHACIEARGTCILPFTLKGTPDLDLIKEEFTLKILNAKDPSGQLQYPELKQTVVSWGAYLFWKDVPDFQLPIRLLDVEEGVDLGSPSGLQLLRTLYRKEWKFGEGLLWELVIVPGLDGNFGLVLIFHHALCDVLALQKLFDKCSNPSILAKVKSQESVWSLLPFKIIHTFFRIPYDAAIFLASTMRTTLLTKSEPCPPSQSSNSSCNIGLKETSSLTTLIPKSNLTLASTAFPLHDLKRTARAHDISVNALLMSCIQGSLTKVWKDEGNSILYFPTPAPSHPAKLRNVGGMGYVELNKDHQGQESRQEIEKQLQSIKSSSTFPLLVRILGALSGSLPSFLLRRTINGASGNLRTILLSTFVFSRGPFSLFGYPVLRVESLGSDHAGTRVVAFFAFSSEDSMRFAVMGDTEVVSEVEGNALVQGVVDEVQDLKNTLELRDRDHTSVTIQTKHTDKEYK